MTNLPTNGTTKAVSQNIPFFNSNNSVVYNLIHCTGHPTGFDLFKATAWKVFDDQSSGKRTYNNSEYEQTSSYESPVSTANDQGTGESFIQESLSDTIDREVIVKAINDSGLLSYDVRNVRINNYLHSLYSLARLLRQSGKYIDATDDVLEEIVKMIREYVADLKRAGEYDEMAGKVMEFQMKSQIFDVFSETVNDNFIQMITSTTAVDIDRQFRRAETRLGNEGVGNKYGHHYYDKDNPNAFKIDVILFAANDDCYEKLLSFAKESFHRLNDSYRRKIVGLEDRFIRQYNNIVSDGVIVSKHNFRLPDTISMPHETNGKDYTDHLFVSDTGTARINLNSWQIRLIYKN